MFRLCLSQLGEIISIASPECVICSTQSWPDLSLSHLPARSLVLSIIQREGDAQKGLFSLLGVGTGEAGMGSFAEDKQLVSAD